MKLKVVYIGLPEEFKYYYSFTKDGIKYINTKCVDYVEGDE